METKDKNGFEGNEYEARIRMKPETLAWLKENKGSKSAAAYLEELITYIRNTKQFKKKK